MKNNNKMKKIILYSLYFLVSFSFLISCKNEDDDYSVKATFQSGSNYISDNMNITTGDTATFKFNMTSSKAMKYIYIECNYSSGSDTTLKVIGSKYFPDQVIELSDSEQNSYSDTLAIVAKNAGTKTVRFTVLDANENLLYRKDFTISVTSDYNFFSRRVLTVPDSSSNPSNKCYLDVDNGETYSYSDLKSNPALIADIDLGYYQNGKSHVLYSLSNNQFPYYDLTGYTCNTTYIKSYSSTEANIVSSSAIAYYCGKANIGTSVIASGLSANGCYCFKTSSGKYGIIYVTYLNNTDSYDSDNYIRIDIKIQK
jgi:hypothetical protein